MTAETTGSALLQRRPLQWALLCACWAFIAIFYTSQAGLQATYAGASFAWWRVLRAELVYSFLWVVLTLAVLRLDRRFPLDTGKWRMSFLVHLGVSIVVSALHPMAMVGLMRLLGWGRDPSQPFWEVGKLSAVTAFHINLTFYWGILAVRYIVRTTGTESVSSGHPSWKHGSPSRNSRSSRCSSIRISCSTPLTRSPFSWPKTPRQPTERSCA